MNEFNLCSGCGEIKEINIENFRACYYKTGAPYFKKRCRICEKKKAQEWQKTHIEQNKKAQKIWRDKNKQYKKEWNAKNRILNNEKDTIRRNSDPAYKIKKLVSGTIRKALKKSGNIKNNSILISLQYSMEELRKHLENQFKHWMTWDNHGPYNSKVWNDNDSSTWTWQIDHIIPHSTFNYTSMNSVEFIQCWGLNNLRPYGAKQNILDGAYRIRHK